ncbi:MAG TPA: CaiB/BaiF CoA-transferase family protein, partial [Devosia sp.]|nr:CaiB/BaiF CoA-transferase family protein [Devosia sp.]
MTDAPAPHGPLHGLVIVDFSQFLAGPLAALKLADMGARVIKIERPGSGDLGRSLYLSDLDIHGTNTLFHAINRNKQSYAANLKSPDDLAKVKALVRQADVVIQNFRPGVIAQYGLDYEGVQALNPRAVYASISGYGDKGEWVDLPGQDLLAQARSGLMWLTGSAEDPPMPMGLAIADQLAGNIAVQGILAGLLQRGVTGKGTHVQTSLIEALLDFQFEVLTTHFNDPDNRLPQRSAVNNAHAYLAAPYGVYRTQDGFLAIAMTPVPKLGQVLGCTALLQHDDPQKWFTARDAIKAELAEFLAQHSTAHWLGLLVPADIWATEVLDWDQLQATDGFKTLDFVQSLQLSNGERIQTTRSPLRFDGRTLKSERPAPNVGQHNAEIDADFA